MCHSTISLRMKFYERNGRGSSVDIENIPLLQVRSFDGTRYSRASLHSVQPRYVLCETFSVRTHLKDIMYRCRFSITNVVFLLPPLELTKSYNHFRNYD